MQVPERPPVDSPPIALTIEYRDVDEAPPVANADLLDGRLVVHATDPSAPSGVAFSDRILRDVVIDARLTLERGSDDTLFGLYVRQTSAADYVAWGMSPTGRVVAGIVTANTWHPVADADLAPDLPFAHGTGYPNRFQIVSFGPSIVFVLNGAIVTATTVDARYKEGYAGYFLARGTRADAADLAVDWVQVRSVLTNQPA